jgi:hypothetical protein
VRGLTGVYSTNVTVLASILTTSDYYEYLKAEEERENITRKGKPKK